MEYLGKHRIDWRTAAAFVICIFLFSYGTFLVFDDAAYHDAVTTGRKRTLDYLPRWILQALMASSLLVCLASVPPKLGAVLGGRLSFGIRQDGVRRFAFLWRKQAFMPWHEMLSLRVSQHLLIFTGQTSEGEVTSIDISLIGQDANKVVATVAHFRPDIIEALV